MKIKNIIKFVFVLELLMLISCQKEMTFPNKFYISQSQFSVNTSMTLYDGVGSTDISISSVYKMKEDAKITIKVCSEEFINKFNKEHNTEFKIVPEDAITLEPNEITIKKNRAFSNPCRVTVRKWEGYVNGTDYVIPIRIDKVSNDMKTIKGSDYIMIGLQENIVSNAAYAPGNKGINFHLIDKDKFFGDVKGKPYGQVTIEGRIMYKKLFSVPGNWRADFFYGFGLQLLTKANGSIDVRFPDSKFITGEKGIGKMSLNEWHHFALTNDNGVITFYLDGDPLITYSYSGELKADGIAIGGWSDNCGLCVDEYRIWRTVRTAKQIKKYKCIVDANNPDLWAYYKFNETEGKIAKDSSPNGNDLETKTNIEWISNVTCP